MNYYYIASKNMPYQLAQASLEKNFDKLRYSVDGMFCIVETSEHMPEFNPMTQEEITNFLQNNQEWSEV